MIETIFMLVVLLLIFFVIAEFARAWYLKNSLNNAVRVGARLAVVTDDLRDASEPCASATDVVIAAVCNSPGVPKDKTTVSVDHDGAAVEAESGDTVTVSATQTFNSLVPLIQPLSPDSIYSSVSMRYE